TMSGVKDAIVNLRQSEYNRMRNACRRMDNVDQNIRSNVNSMASSLRRDLDNRMSVVNRRYDNLEQGMSRMSNDMRRMEADTHNRIRAQARQFQQGLETLDREFQGQIRSVNRRQDGLERDIHNLADNVDQLAANTDRRLNQQRREYMDGLNALDRKTDAQRQEYTHMIQEQGRRFSQALSDQRRELEGRIREVHNAMIQKEMNERDMAAQWLGDTETFLDAIGREYRHEKFKPGELEKLRAEMALAQGNMNGGSFQAATAAAQQTYLRASELRMELEQLEMEWEAHLEAARRNAAEVLAACDAQTVCKFTFDTEEGAEEVDGQVDFWTQGGLAGLRNRVAEEMKRLGAPEDLSLEDLKQSIAQSEAWRQESLDLAEKAKDALIASQLRNNIGQTIEEALIDQGWEIDDAAYEGEDFRDAVHVKLKHLSGDEIVTIVTPEESPEGTIRNNLRVAFFDRNTNDENSRLERLRTIHQVLEAEGLEMGPPTCQKGTENQPSTDESLLNFEKVKQPKRQAGAR
ncbi:MAG: hypothetical protein ACLFRG_22555, partial [Desulfococcaceae bacterium]